MVGDNVDDDETAWVYDAGEPYSAKKHGWSRAYAGVKLWRGRWVTCCPSGLTREVAEQHLRRGRGDHDVENPPEGALPERVYVVIDGVPYQARPSAAGSYHACPMLQSDFDRLSPLLKRYIEEQAEGQGYATAAWFQRIARVMRR